MGTLGGAPDPDWYLDHVLIHADPDRGGLIEEGPAARWEAWWRDQVRAIDEQWPEFAAAARRQGLVVTTRQVAEAGADRHLVGKRVRAGIWSAPLRGVVALVGESEINSGNSRFLPDRRRHAIGSAAAALLNAGHAVSCTSAAILHGLPTLAVPARPVLTVSPGRPTHRAGARTAALLPDEVTAWFGVPVTDIARTIVDSARHDRRNGLLAADAALHEELVTVELIEAALNSARSRRGIRQAREVLALAEPKAESPLETLTRLAIHDSGLPMPEPQVEIEVPGRRRPLRVDLMWPEHRLILEVDGREKYRDDALWDEKRRERALRRLGYTVERVVWDDIMRDWPATEALLRELLGC